MPFARATRGSWTGVIALVVVLLLIGWGPRSSGPGPANLPGSSGAHVRPGSTDPIGTPPGEDAASHVAVSAAAVSIPLPASRAASPTEGTGPATTLPRAQPVPAVLDRFGQRESAIALHSSDRSAGGAAAEEPHPFGALAVSTPVANHSSVDVLQSIWFNTTASGGSGGYSFTWWGLPGGCKVTKASVFCTPKYPGNLNISVTVEDSSSSTATSGTLPFTIYSDPTITPPVANRSSADAGQSVSFQVTGGGGSGGLVWAWPGLLPGNCTIRDTYAECSRLTGSGTWPIIADVTDSNNFTTFTPIVQFTVYAALILTAPMVTPSTIDVGQPVTFGSIVELGTHQYSYAWSGLPSPCATAVDPTSCTPTRVGTYAVSLLATDSNGGQATSATTSLIVSPLPTVGAVSANRAAADVGQSVTFQAPTTPGSGMDTFAWAGLPEDCPGASDPMTCTVFFAGSYVVQLSETDSNGGTSNSSAPFDLTVDPDPVATFEANGVLLDENDTLTLTTNASTGSGGFGYAYSGLPPGCGGTGPILTCPMTTVGTYTAKLTVTDSNGWSVTPAAVTLTVAPSLWASLSTSSMSPTAGASVAFQASGKGGTEHLHFAWAFGDGSTGMGPSVSHTYDTGGRFTVSLWVNDTIGESAERTLNLTVAPLPSQAGLLGVSAAAWGGIALVAVLAALVALVVRSRRRRTRAQAPTPSEDLPPP